MSILLSMSPYRLQVLQQALRSCPSASCPHAPDQRQQKSYSSQYGDRPSHRLLQMYSQHIPVMDQRNIRLLIILLFSGFTSIPNSISVTLWWAENECSWIVYQYSPCSTQVTTRFSTRIIPIHAGRRMVLDIMSSTKSSQRIRVASRIQTHKSQVRGTKDLPTELNRQAQGNLLCDFPTCHLPKIYQ